MAESAAHNKEQGRGMTHRAQPIVLQLPCQIGRRAALAGLGAGLLGGLAVPAQAARMLPLLPAVMRRLLPSEPAPTDAFATATGQRRTLAAYRSQGVVLNLWATWCLPCKAEMPALDHLAETVAGDRIAVLPVSIDADGLRAVKTFYANRHITHLPILLDPAGLLVAALRAPGIPTTVIIDRGGRMVGRVEGPVQWDAPPSIALLRRMAGPEA